MIDVVAAVVEKDGKYLIAHRPVSKGGEWEFPGGKVEKGETFFEALIREIKEELSVPIKPIRILSSYPKEIRGQTYSIHFVAATLGSEEFVLTEHQSCQWLDLNEIKLLPMSSVDKEFVKQLRASEK
ncbi:MAG: NUDIX domain-containing protein [Bdellovibrionaceae bacterium]|nr:NUDIX domain-containing protein [Pseudobdellovibrionaceae bacterium]